MLWNLIDRLLGTSTDEDNRNLLSFLAAGCGGCFVFLAGFVWAVVWGWRHL